MKDNKIKTGLILALLFTLLLSWGGQVKELKTHIEYLQAEINACSEKIERSKTDISLLQARLDAYIGSFEWAEDGFNYLAIGNSITKHPICDYWWNEIGMAATQEDLDYFHLVETYLNDSHGGVTAYSYNASSWEVTAHDRMQIVIGWDGYLSDKIDLVTIQLSENVTDTTTFENDFREMVQYISNRCPDAQIIVIDDFWDGNKSLVKRNAIEDLDVDFIDLNEIRGKPEYKAGLGTIVYDADGGSHVIEHKGVAAHPGDAGMRYYAEEIIRLIEK